jgi:hypothetical protein
VSKKCGATDTGFAWLMSISDPDERAYAARYSGYAYLDERPHPRFAEGGGPNARLNKMAFGKRRRRPKARRPKKH